MHAAMLGAIFKGETLYEPDTQKCSIVTVLELKNIFSRILPPGKTSILTATTAATFLISILEKTPSFS